MAIWMLSLAIGFIVWGLSMIVASVAAIALPAPIVGIWLIVTGILMLINR